MELKERTKEAGQWLVEQHIADNMGSSFKMSLLYTGGGLLKSVIIWGPGTNKLDPPFTSEEKGYGPFASSLLDLKNYGLLSILEYERNKWEVNILPALFEAVESDFKKLPSNSVIPSVQIGDSGGGPITVVVSTASGSNINVQVNNSQDIANYLRAKLTDELLDKYPALRSQIDELEKDGNQVSPNRIMEIIKGIADTIVKGAAAKLGGESIIYLIPILQEIIHRIN